MSQNVFHELELKLELSSQACDQFLQLTWFHSHPSVERQPDKQLENSYFDTPDLALLASRAALRIRKSGDKFLQTLKTKGTSVGGLHQRGEWEFEIGQATPGGSLPSLQPELFPKDVWPENLDVAQLTPVFETNFTRSGWLWRSAKGSLIELVLDRGQVVSGNQTTALSEIELELLEGDAACVFDLAEAISHHLPMKVSDITKAQRGFELFRPGAWQTSSIVLDETSSDARQLEWVIQSLMTLNSGTDQNALATRLNRLVETGFLPAMDVRPWLLQGNISTLDTLKLGQWLLRLARHAWQRGMA